MSLVCSTEWQGVCMPSLQVRDVGTHTSFFICQIPANSPLESFWLTEFSSRWLHCQTLAHSYLFYFCLTELASLWLHCQTPAHSYLFSFFLTSFLLSEYTVKVLLPRTSFPLATTRSSATCVGGWCRPRCPCWSWPRVRPSRSCMNATRSSRTCWCPSKTSGSPWRPLTRNSRYGDAVVKILIQANKRLKGRLV